MCVCLKAVNYDKILNCLKIVVMSYCLAVIIHVDEHRATYSFLSRISLCKNSAIHRAVTNWKNLPRTFKFVSNLLSLKKKLFGHLIARYIFC